MTWRKTSVSTRWCTLLDCVGVSVDYRLVPEAPYPAPLDDCRCCPHGRNAPVNIHPDAFSTAAEAIASIEEMGWHPIVRTVRPEHNEPHIHPFILSSA